MYQPPIFKQNSFDVMHHLIRANPFATVVCSSNGGLQANHLPLLLHADLSEYGILRGHVSRANSLWRDYDPSIDVLAIFQGAHHYISPSWYPSKEEHGKVVPTWNYVAVHASGPLQIFQERDLLLDHINNLTFNFENARDEPWSVSDAPEDYVQRQLRGIVGIEIKIKSLEGKWKISQNRPEKDRAGVVAGLQDEESEIATCMAKLIANS